MTLLSDTGPVWAQKLREEIGQSVIGQQEVVERLLVALLANGHVLLEGMPGLAKTLLVRSLGVALGVQFERIQFTPDLLPSDVVGTMIYSPATGAFTPHHGPVFANLLLADEINRAPAKVQSALLEAMQERQVTIGGQTHALPKPFFVMATQNPIEQEGTYPLPEAQTDRFLFKLLVDYPDLADETAMLQRWGQVTRQPGVQGRLERRGAAPTAPGRGPGPCRPGGAKLHSLAGAGDARPRHPGGGSHPRAPAQLWRVPARLAGALSGRPRAGLAARAGLCGPRPRAGARAGRAPPPPRPVLRGRGRGNHRRQGRGRGHRHHPGPRARPVK